MNWQIYLEVKLWNFLECCGVDSEHAYVEAKHFALYVHEQSRHLSPIYAQIERKMLDKVDIMDILAHFMKLETPIEPVEAKHLLQRMDNNNNKCIEH